MIRIPPLPYIYSKMSQSDCMAMIRVRDLEVARLVLDAAAKLCEEMAPGGRFLNAGKTQALRALTDAAVGIRAMEFTHD